MPEHTQKSKSTENATHSTHPLGSEKPLPDIIQLQQWIGNQALQRLLSSGADQPPNLPALRRIQRQRLPSLPPLHSITIHRAMPHIQRFPDSIEGWQQAMLGKKLENRDQWVQFLQEIEPRAEIRITKTGVNINGRAFKPSQLQTLTSDLSLVKLLNSLLPKEGFPDTPLGWSMVIKSKQLINKNEWASFLKTLEPSLDIKATGNGVNIGGSVFKPSKLQELVSDQELVTRLLEIKQSAKSVETTDENTPTEEIVETISETKKPDTTEENPVDENTPPEEIVETINETKKPDTTEENPITEEVVEVVKETDSKEKNVTKEELTETLTETENTTNEEEDISSTLNKKELLVKGYSSFKGNLKDELKESLKKAKTVAVDQIDKEILTKMLKDSTVKEIIKVGVGSNWIGEEVAPQNTSVGYLQNPYKGGKSHNKFNVSEDSVSTHSANITFSATEKNTESGVTFENPEAAKLFDKYFQLMKGSKTEKSKEGQEFTQEIEEFNQDDPNVNVALAPFTDLSQFVLKQLQGMSHVVIRMYLVSSYAQTLIQGLCQLAEEGVKISVIVDEEQFNEGYDRDDRIYYVQEALRTMAEAGIEVETQTTKAKKWDKRQGKYKSEGIMHDKLILAYNQEDDTFRVMVGSSGFTRSVAQNINYENLVSINDQALYEWFLENHHKASFLSGAWKTTTRFNSGKMPEGYEGNWPGQGVPESHQ